MKTDLNANSAPPEPLEIPRDIFDAMVAHCVREAPLECCGLLCGTAPRVSLFYPLRNDTQSETRYNADPQELIAAHIDFRRKRAEILAIYHSHPRWRPFPARPTWPRITTARSRGSSYRFWAIRPTSACGASTPTPTRNYPGKSSANSKKGTRLFFKKSRVPFFC